MCDLEESNIIQLDFPFIDEHLIPIRYEICYLQKLYVTKNGTRTNKGLIALYNDAVEFLGYADLRQRRALEEFITRPDDCFVYNRSVEITEAFYNQEFQRYISPPKE